MIEKLAEYKFRADKIYMSFENQGSEADLTELEESFVDLENEILQLEGYPFSDKEQSQYNTITTLLRSIRKEFDLFDEDSERESMFPNGEDE